MLFSAIVFFVALIGIVALFSFKQWELSRERVVAPDIRMRADAQARHLKELMEAGRKDLEHLPPLLLYAAQRIIHGIAVDAGHVAHWLGVQAHKLADSVSHKRNFERRETKSEFLKKVAEHKSGNGGVQSETPPQA
jgi:hypothetical protein